MYRSSSSSVERPSVDAALALLRNALADAIRAEQLTDRLTGLANNESLSEWVEERLYKGSTFWIAFIEVDRFKSINDKYGYHDADQLLIKIARQLNVASSDFFASGAVPIRAHGDEFFMAGELDNESVRDDDISRALDQLRGNIATLRFPVRDKEPMNCTVSIGWLLSTDLWDVGLTPARIRSCLELAVARAKLTRNAVLRFSKEMNEAKTVDGRSDCGACRAKFSVTVEQNNLRPGKLRCPNCGVELERPHALIPASSTLGSPAPTNDMGLVNSNACRPSVT